MFRSHRLCKSHIAACSRQKRNFFSRGNLPQGITPCLHRNNPIFRIDSTRRSIRLAHSQPPLRELLFEWQPSYDIEDTIKVDTAVYNFNHVDTLEELQFVLDREFPVNNVTRRRDLLLSNFQVLKALERCYLKSSSNVSKIHYTNAVICRFQKIGLSMPLGLMYGGLKAAAWGNHPVTMKQYFTLFNPVKRTVDFPHSFDLKLWNEIFQAILVVARCTPRHDLEAWRLKKAQWAEVVTGWNTDESSFARRERCIYDVLVNFGVRGLASYFRLVRQFCSTDAILRMWLEHHLIYDTGGLPPNTLNFIFNSFIQLLLAKDDPKRAWEVARNTAPRFGAIQDKSWQLLLQHPEFFDRWIPGMDKFVVDALEKYASYVERQLGVRWTGGEDGIHVAK